MTSYENHVVSHTQAATFRLDKAVLDQLRLEAEQKQINLNTLVNQIVRSHIEWHANAAKAGFIPVRRYLIRRLFDPLTQEQIDTLGTSLSQDLSFGNMMMVRGSTEKSILEFLERWLRACGFNYQREIKENYYTYVIQHEMGIKWSYYLARLFEEIASIFKTAKPDIEATENALYIKLKISES